MSDQNNPYGGGYQTAPQTSVSFGEAANGTAAPAEAVFDVTTASFKAQVLDASRDRVVLVDFWAPWCGPCKQLTPVLEKVVREAGGRVVLAKMNIDDHPSIAGQLGIQSIPAVIAFRDGRPVDGFMGALPESQIREFLAKIGGAEESDPIADALAAAAEARQAGDLSTAAQIYQAILEREPSQAEAVAGLGEMLVEAGQVEQASALLANVKEEDARHVAGLKARIEMAEKVAALGDPAALEKRLAEDPKDHQARFDLAMIENARGDRTAAADHLLSIMKQDRAWNDEGARKQLLQFFEAWGMDDEATLAARRKLSSLLFS
jgi:putative thioredoxin